MYDLTALQLLLLVNAYLLLALLLLGFSAKSLVCRLRGGERCTQRHRPIKFLIATPLALSCLALLAVGLFALGMSHGSRPHGYQVALFAGGCLLPLVLLLVWAWGSHWLDLLWALAVVAAFGYLTLFNPALYVEYWADSNVHWAQRWMARHHQSGDGGLYRSDSAARRWYQRAAESGDALSQFQMGQQTRQRNAAARWYRLAAEQEHAGAMVQLVRLSGDETERQHWLQRALAQEHPDALYLAAEQQRNRDLPRARQLLLEAAEQGSRLAMIALIEQYRQGGVLFGADAEAAAQWRARLQGTPASGDQPAWMPPALVIQQSNPTAGAGVAQNTDPAALYTRAQRFLDHPAKDVVLHQRALALLTRASQQGHADAALALARLAESEAAGPLEGEALRWYRRAAELGSRQALTRLASVFKERPGATLDDLLQSRDYNQRLLAQLVDENSPRQRLSRQHWAGELRDTERKIAQLQRLGGSWQAAVEQAENYPQQEYRLAKELIASGEYGAGMLRLRSAAARDNPQARFELAQRTLRGPRSFSQEINAVAELQRLDRQGHLGASLMLGTLHQSGTGILPRNYYLARQLFRKALADPDLTDSAQRWLDRTPELTDSLTLDPGGNVAAQLSTWYRQTAEQAADEALLQRQYDALRDHFRDPGPVARAADSDAQYQLAQTLQSHDLERAIHWLQLAAEGGHGDAQYELAVRMIRGKKNSAAEQQQLQHWARSAAAAGHVGAMAFLANQYTRGSGGFTKSEAEARAYYQQALSAADTELLYRGKIAGRDINIERAALERALARLEP